jgi:hypothetical protein
VFLLFSQSRYSDLSNSSKESRPAASQLICSFRGTHTLCMISKIMAVYKWIWCRCSPSPNLPYSHPEHIPVFRALLETTDPHQKANLVHTNMRTWSTLKKKRLRGQTHKHTLQLLDRIGPVGRFGEKIMAVYKCLFLCYWIVVANGCS